TPNRSGFIAIGVAAARLEITRTCLVRQPAIPATPTLNFFNAPRRVADWANPLASSSNLLFTTFLSFCFTSRCLTRGPHHPQPFFVIDPVLPPLMRTHRPLQQSLSFWHP